MNLITCADFAQQARITDRAARSAFAKAEWRGHKLPVTQVQGKRGGAGGACWVLHVELCPPELRALLAGDETAVSTTIEDALHAQIGDRHIAVARDRQRIIAPILKTSPGSLERAQAFRDIAAQPNHHIAGTLRPVAERTLRDWVNEAERKSVVALLPQARKDRGTQRVLITRAWDGVIGLDEAARAKLAAEIERLARSMVANDGTSTREVLRLCSDHLARISAEAGSPLPAKQLRRVCALNPKWAKRIGLDRFRLVHMYDKDHKTWQDKAVPRIRRELHETPMGLLIGDVHYVDMLVEEGDQPIRVRLIAWMDAASMFAWVTPVFLAPRIGIRQEDVAESLAQVALCPHGGIPQNFYLDNGSEYSEVAGTVMIRLAHLAEADFGVTLARPYSPTSKGEIEGFFNVLEGIFKGLPGWIGGDRTNKKTANKGKVVAPYRDGIAALEADIQAAVSIYNDRPQSGRLQGLSPVKILERKIADTGFAARVPSEESFDLIFSKPQSRVIRQGMITFDNRQWHTPALDDLPLGARVDVLVPLRANRDRIFVRHEGRDLGWAEAEQRVKHGDRRGAQQQAQLEAGRVASVRRLKSQIDPTVSTFELQKAAVRQIAPQTNAPENWSMRGIDKTTMPSPADLEAREDAKRRALIDEFQALVGPKEREASGCYR